MNWLQPSTSISPQVDITRAGQSISGDRRPLGTVKRSSAKSVRPRGWLATGRLRRDAAFRRSFDRPAATCVIDHCNRERRPSDSSPDLRPLIHTLYPGCSHRPRLCRVRGGSPRSKEWPRPPLRIEHAQVLGVGVEAAAAVRRSTLEQRRLRRDFPAARTTLPRVHPRSADAGSAAPTRLPAGLTGTTGEFVRPRSMKSRAARRRLIAMRFTGWIRTSLRAADSSSPARPALPANPHGAHHAVAGIRSPQAGTTPPRVPLDARPAPSRGSSLGFRGGGARAGHSTTPQAAAALNTTVRAASLITPEGACGGAIETSNHCDRRRHDRPRRWFGPKGHVVASGWRPITRRPDHDIPWPNGALVSIHLAELCVWQAHR